MATMHEPEDLTGRPRETLPGMRPGRGFVLDRDGEKTKAEALRQRRKWKPPRESGERPPPLDGPRLRLRDESDGRFRFAQIGEAVLWRRETRGWVAAAVKTLLWERLAARRALAARRSPGA